jgi:hypothetical protein
VKKDYIKNNFWLFYHIGLLMFSAIAAILMKFNQLGNALDPTVVLAFLTIFLTSANIGYLTIYMVKKAANYDHNQLTKRILAALVIFYVAAFLIANIVVSLGVFCWFLYTGKDLSDFFPNLFKDELRFANGSFFHWIIFFTIAFFYILWQKSAKREQLLIEENLKYRYNTLKSQVNPHFLFNSLNTLSEIVYLDAKKADNYIQKLAGIYRYILENEETDLIYLNEELEFVKQYFSLQKERDNDKISLKIECQHSERYKTIPVSLQLLVENALKHNSMSQINPLEIQIYCSDEYIMVSNALQRKNIIESSPQTGLANLKERVKLIMGREIIVNEENKRFIVKLPIIRA